LYQIVFKFCKFLDSKLLNYWRFCNFDSLGANIWLFYVIFHSLRLNKSNLTSIACLKYIIKYLYQFIFRFCQFLDSKLTYICWITGYFLILTPLGANIWFIYAIFHSLRLNKSNLASIECLKCIIKCLYQFVFKFCQFSDPKFTYLLNYCRFYDFDHSHGLFLAILRYFHS
jgi:hypothetical protein